MCACILNTIPTCNCIVWGACAHSFQAHRHGAHSAACIHSRLRPLVQQLHQPICAHNLCAGARIRLALHGAVICMTSSRRLSRDVTQAAYESMTDTD